MRDPALIRKLGHILLSSPAPVDGSDECVEKLYGFAELVAKWNKSMNLVSEETPIEIIDNHIIDAVYASFHLPEVDTILDIGSGAGFPGVPLSILRGKTRVVLIECRKKPISFLKEVRLRLKLSNLEIVNSRIEEFSPEKLEVNSQNAFAISRAYSPADKFFSDLKWLFERKLPVYYLGGAGSEILTKEALLSAGRTIGTEERYHPGESGKKVVLFQ